MSVEFATIGEITLDDTVLETGELRRAQSGGGALYSALAIRLLGHEVGINSVIGHEYPEEYLQILRSHGIATSGILRIPGWSLRLWLLHEENNRKQQVHKLQASTFAELDSVRPDPPSEYFTAFENLYLARAIAISVISVPVLALLIGWVTRTVLEEGD